MFTTRVPPLAQFFVASLFFFNLSRAEDCIPYPLSMPIENVTVGAGLQRRGVSIKVGDSDQQLSLIPRWRNNNTFLHGPRCDFDYLTTEACSVYRGGFSNFNDSATKGNLGSDYKPPSEIWDSESYAFITDTIKIGEELALEDFPIARPLAIYDNDIQSFDPQHILGMGPGSTFMNSLKNLGRIASRSYGFHWGLDGVTERDQAPGSFVIGGYDKAKTYGDGMTQKFINKASCPTKMVVAIQDIVLNFENGTDASIFPSKKNSGTTLTACIVPGRPSVMEMPQDPYFENLLGLIGNEDMGRSKEMGLDWDTVILDSERPIFDGDLTFKFDSNLHITIPNHQLIVPERYIDSDGAMANNASRPVIRIHPLEEVPEGTMPILGRYFLTAAYVAANEDAGEFTLWEANPTTKEDLVAVDEENKVLKAEATCTPKPTASAVPDASDDKDEGNDKVDSGKDSEKSSSDGSSTENGISTAAVAGISTSVAVVAVASIGILIWWCMRRRRRRAAAKAEIENQEAMWRYASSYIHSSPSPKAGFPSQGYPHFIPQEMSSEQQPRVKPVELP